MPENTVGSSDLVSSIKAAPLKEGQATPEQASVFTQVREILGPFEEEYHRQIPLIIERVKDGSVRKTPLRPSYATQVQLASGGGVEAMIQTGKHGGQEIMLKFVIDGNVVYFNNEGRVEKIEIAGTAARQHKNSRLPEVSSLRARILDHGESAINNLRVNTIGITVGEPARMGYRFTLPGSDGTWIEALVQQNGSLIEQWGKMTRYGLKNYMGPNFPKLVGDALRALNPANN